jgi:hypothetical protein
MIHVAGGVCVCRRPAQVLYTRVLYRFVLIFSVGLFSLTTDQARSFAQEAEKKATPAQQKSPVESEYKPSETPRPVELPPELTEAQRVKLDRGLDWFKYIEDNAPVRSADKNEDEHAAFNYILQHAAKQEPAALARHALRDVPFPNLVEDIRRDYQLELIHIEGRVVRIDELKATDMLAKTTPIQKLFEVWLFPRERANQDNPICLMVSELPEGVKPGRLLSHWVGFDAYSFKLLKYESGQKLENGKHQWRVAPLFLGRSFYLIETPSDDDVWSFRGMFVPAVVTVIVLVGVTALAINWYFQRGDKAVRAQLARRPVPNPFSTPDSPPQSGTSKPGNAWSEND